MKIAMIGQKGIATGAGGVEKHVEEIAKRLVEQGNQVTVYYRNTFISEDLDFYKGIKLKKINTVESKSLDAIVYTLKATIDAIMEGYDVYHYHALGPASLSFIPKLIGKKVIVTVHGLDWQRAKWGKLAKFYLKFGEFIAGTLANQVISVSEGVRLYFIEKYKKRNEKNTTFIPNGVNIEEEVKANLIKDYGLKGKDYILFLARLVPEKGVHYLVEAYKKLDTKVKLVIAGGSSFTDDYYSYLQSISNENENIIYTGNVKGNLLKELYSNCLFYVLPSDIEGMPLSLLEALSYGRYCLISDINENKDVIKNEVLGSSFKKSDIDDLAYKLKSILNNKLYVGNNEERKKYIAKNYNWDSITKDTIDRYNELFFYCLRY